MAGMMVGAVAAVAAFAMPASGAPDLAKRAFAPLSSARIFFTPASADPKLAALIARSGVGSAPFRFTPAGSRADRRPVLAALQLNTPKAGVVTLRGNGAEGVGSVGVAPIAYNLVATSSAKRLTVPGDAPKMDLGTSPSGRRIDPSFNLAGARPSKLKAVTDRPTDTARLTGDAPQMIDVGGAYSLRRNIDVTAGVRYKSQYRDRLAPMPDDRRGDSQAVYVGTTFKF